MPPYSTVRSARSWSTGCRRTADNRGYMGCTEVVQRRRRAHPRRGADRLTHPEHAVARCLPEPLPGHQVAEHPADHGGADVASTRSAAALTARSAAPGSSWPPRRSPAANTGGARTGRRCRGGRTRGTGRGDRVRGRSAGSPPRQACRRESGQRVGNFGHGSALPVSVDQGPGGCSRTRSGPPTR